MKENKIKKYIKDTYFKYTGKIRQKKIKDKKFTIISNNCWGGIIYRNHHIPYQSPTCGLFFMAPEYIKFIYNIKDYLYNEIVEINIEESKYKEYLKQIKYDALIVFSKRIQNALKEEGYNSLLLHFYPEDADFSLLFSNGFSTSRRKVKADQFLRELSQQPESDRRQFLLEQYDDYFIE